MWGRKIVYILLVIITSYIALMYESPVPGVFLAFELLLPIALFALTWYHKKNVKVTIGNGQQVADCEEKIEIPIRFHNLVSDNRCVCKSKCQQYIRWRKGIL